jgi:hypothetical protein
MGVKLYLEHEDVLARNDIFHSALLNAEERQRLFDIFISKCDWHSIYFK